MRNACPDVRVKKTLVETKRIVESGKSLIRLPGKPAAPEILASVIIFDGSKPGAIATGFFERIKDKGKGINEEI